MFGDLLSIHKLGYSDGILLENCGEKENSLMSLGIYFDYSEENHLFEFIKETISESEHCINLYKVNPNAVFSMLLSTTNYSSFTEYMVNYVGSVDDILDKFNVDSLLSAMGTTDLPEIKIPDNSSALEDTLDDDTVDDVVFAGYAADHNDNNGNSSMDEENSDLQDHDNYTDRVAVHDDNATNLEGTVGNPVVSLEEPIELEEETTRKTAEFSDMDVELKEETTGDTTSFTEGITELKKETINDIPESSDETSSRPGVPSESVSTYLDQQINDDIETEITEEANGDKFVPYKKVDTCKKTCEDSVQLLNKTYEAIQKIVKYLGISEESKEEESNYAALCEAEKGAVKEAITCVFNASAGNIKRALLNTFREAEEMDSISVCAQFFAKMVKNIDFSEFE